MSSPLAAFIDRMRRTLDTISRKGDARALLADMVADNDTVLNALNKATLGELHEAFKALSSDKLASIRERLLQMEDEKWPMVQTIQFKDPTTALILSIFAGNLGVDRFYIGDTGMGVGKLLTCGGLYVWTIVDWFLIQGATKEKNMELFNRTFMF